MLSLTGGLKVFVALEPCTVEEFLPRQVDIGPGRGTDADDAGRAHAFGDEVRFKTDLDAAAAHRSVSGHLRDVEDGVLDGHVRRSRRCPLRYASACSQLH